MAIIVARHGTAAGLERDRVGRVFETTVSEHARSDWDQEVRMAAGATEQRAGYEAPRQMRWDGVNGEPVGVNAVAVVGRAHNASDESCAVPILFWVWCVLSESESRRCPGCVSLKSTPTVVAASRRSNVTFVACHGTRTERLPTRNSSAIALRRHCQVADLFCFVLSAFKPVEMAVYSVSRVLGRTHDDGGALVGALAAGRPGWHDRGSSAIELLCVGFVQRDRFCAVLKRQPRSPLCTRVRVAAMHGCFPSFAFAHAVAFCQPRAL